MEKITVSEANRNFTKMTALVNEKGAVQIERWGNVQYVIMTKDVYEQLKSSKKENSVSLEKGIVGKDKLGWFTIKKDKDVVTIVTLLKHPNGATAYWRILKVPADEVAVSGKKNLDITVGDKTFYFRAMDMEWAEEMTEDESSLISEAERKVRECDSPVKGTFHGNSLLAV